MAAVTRPGLFGAVVAYVGFAAKTAFVITTLPDGDVTTQMSKWITANVPTNDDFTKGSRVGLGAALGLPAATDHSALMTKFIKR